MPSWNIHTAHAERLLARHDGASLGIEDANAFLFGSYVPDIHIGFMVPTVSYRLDYCTTHLAKISMIPVADADRFWDLYIAYRTPESPAGLSLTLGAWAHLLADRFYNGNFRTFWREHDVAGGDEQRVRKQADFELFGQSLGISTLVEATPELLEATRNFKPYNILEADTRESIRIANAITASGGVTAAAYDAVLELYGIGTQEYEGSYQLLSREWLSGVFDSCEERLVAWLRAWRELLPGGDPVTAAVIREHAGFGPARPDNNHWMYR